MLRVHVGSKWRNAGDEPLYAESEAGEFPHLHVNRREQRRSPVAAYPAGSQ